jgi:DNA-binding transcriptional MerR regulator
MTTTREHTAGVELTVGQVAETFGITVRALHHYDEIGLVVPGHRTPAGYRVYTEDDLARLGRVVAYRRLGLPLEEVRALLDGQGSTEEHLRRQRAVVVSRLDELEELVAAIDRALERTMSEQPATTEELRELFGSGFDEEHVAEAQERWGETDAWSQSRSRTARYTQADWAEVKAEGDAVNAAFVAAMRGGEPAASRAAMDAAEAQRRHIHARFYDLDHASHRGLGDMYLADPRFTATYEDIEPGLAQYVRDAIHANADRHERS